MLDILSHDPFQKPLDSFEAFTERAIFRSCLACPDKGRLIEEDNECWDNFAALMKRNQLSPLAMALDLATNNGWKIFPACLEDGAKKSYLSAKHAPGGLNWGMSDDPKQLRRNFDNRKWRDKVGVGVPTGEVNGIFVVEGDTAKGHGADVDGIASVQALQKQHGRLPRTLMARSPTGSVHRYFSYPAGIKVKSSTSEIGKGVDVKSDGGMVIAPTTLRPGVGYYEWLNDAQIADAPSWLIDLVRDDNAPSRDGLSSEYDPNDPFQQFNLPKVGEVAAAVAVIPNDDTVDREQWVAIGHALKAACPGDEGLEIFKEWSARWTGGDYDEEYTINAWKGFKPDRTGFAKIVKLANENDPNWHEQLRTLKKEPERKSLMQSSAEFVAGFTPPDYLIDTLLQRRYVYSFTAPTGSGKTAIALRIAAHVALGLPLADKEVERGRVLFFAGENPDDVRSRWIKLCEEMKQEADTLDVVFMPFPLDLMKARERIDEEADERGPFSLLIVDTSASFYSGDDENDNVQLRKHAAMLRTFTDLPGGPTVLVTCHPTKTPNLDNLLPRGGGSFLAEVDGNLVAIYDQSTRVAEVTTHGKFRGPEFAPFSFRLVAGRSEKLVDTKGRSIWTVVARPISNEEMEALEEVGHSDQDDVLRAMLDEPGLSMMEMAKHLDWNTMDGKPHKVKVFRVLKELVKSKLAEKRRDGHYVLTTKGTAEAEKIPQRVGEKPKTEAQKDNVIRFSRPEKEGD